MKDFPLKMVIAGFRNKIWLIQLTEICNPSFKMNIADALIFFRWCSMNMFAVHCLVVNFPFFGNMMNTFMMFDLVTLFLWFAIASTEVHRGD